MLPPAAGQSWHMCTASDSQRRSKNILMCNRFIMLPRYCEARKSFGSFGSFWQVFGSFWQFLACVAPSILASIRPHAPGLGLVLVLDMLFLVSCRLTPCSCQCCSSLLRKPAAQTKVSQTIAQPIATCKFWPCRLLLRNGSHLLPLVSVNSIQERST